MEGIVNELIKYFLQESSHPIIDIPKNYVNKREFLRGLINVREINEVPKEIIEKESELLKLELKEKNILDISNIKAKLSVYQGDITNVRCDAIVNLSHSKLMGCMKPNHNCVSNKIHTYAGISLKLKIKEITKGKDIDVGKVILTEGYNLPCKYIIHTPKPTVEDCLSKKLKNEIVDMYINSLELAKKNKIKTLCVPNLSVSSNIKEEVARITVNTIKKYLQDNNEIEKVLINTYTLEDSNIYNDLL